VPFTLVHAGKYRAEDKNTDNTETKPYPEKQTIQNTAKQNYPDTWPENEVCLLYNGPELKWAN